MNGTEENECCNFSEKQVIKTLKINFCLVHILLKINCLVTLQVLFVTNMKMAVLWDAVPCSLVGTD
jgi:hypothetical protein